MQRVAAIALFALLAAASAPSLASDWPLFGHDPQRTGVDAGDTILTTANVNKLHARWQTSLGTVADSTPILIGRVRVHGGVRAMLYQTGTNGVTYALDALTGKIVWRFATRGPGITTSTPAEDPSGTSIYVPGIDGYVHKVDAATGHEVHAPGFPAHLTQMDGSEKDASSLNVANGYLYAATSGFIGDAPPYDGHVLAVQLSTGAWHVFNSLCSRLKTLPTPTSCSQSDSGIWGRGGVVVDPDSTMNGAIYAATGNGNFDASTGGDDYGDSLLGLSANAATLLGHYTPADYGYLDENDVDLGSTSPAVLPRQNSSKTPLTIVQGGKDAIWRLIDRRRLPGVGHELQEINLPQGLYSTPAVWTDPHGSVLIFLGFSGEIDGYRFFVNGKGESELAQIWHSSGGSSSGEGSSPVVSNGIVFGAYDDTLVALNAYTGRMLWNSAQPGSGRNIGPIHWESPIVVNGWLYCSDENGHLTAYALK